MFWLLLMRDGCQDRMMALRRLDARGIEELAQASGARHCVKRITHRIACK
jgi:hypothetical protein